MKNNGDNKLFKVLEDKLDAFLEKGLQLSKNLTQSEREKVIMKVLNELVETAVRNVKESEEDLSEEELTERRKQIAQVFKAYYERKIKEYKEKT